MQTEWLLGAAMRHLLVALPILSAFVVAPADAKIIDGTYTVTASDFTPANASVTGADPITVSFTLSFDDTQSDRFLPISNFTSTYPLILFDPGGIGYYAPTDTLSLQSDDSVGAGFFLTIDTAATDPTFGGANWFAVRQQFPHGTDATNGTVTFTPAAVPEPASLMLLAVGMAGVGALRRRLR